MPTPVTQTDYVRQGIFYGVKPERMTAYIERSLTEDNRPHICWNGESPCGCGDPDSTKHDRRTHVGCHWHEKKVNSDDINRDITRALRRL